MAAKQVNSLPLDSIVRGNAFEVLPSFPEESVDCVCFSPPYWGLRDYKLEPIVLGGRADCEHEWVEDVQKPKGGSAGGCFADRPSKQAGSEAQHREIKTNFCVKCGAWRGSFGLEPHPSLYVDHLALLCSLLKRVLKKSGALWLNMGDTYFGFGGAGGD